MENMYSMASGRFNLHMSEEKVDKDFFAYRKYIRLHKVFYISYNFCENELSNLLNLEDNTITTIDTISTKSLIGYLKKYSGYDFIDFEIFFEGIDYSFIENNFDEVFSKVNKILNSSVRYHFGIINIPKNVQNNFLKKIEKKLPLNDSRQIVKKRSQEYIEQNIVVHTKSTVTTH